MRIAPLQRTYTIRAVPANTNDSVASSKDHLVGTLKDEKGVQLVKNYAKLILLQRLRCLR